MLAFGSVQQSNHCAREEFLYELKAGPAGGRLRRPSSAGGATPGAGSPTHAPPSGGDGTTMKRTGAPIEAGPCELLAQTAVGRTRSVEGRSHNDALVGCIVWSTTASSSTERVSRSISSRSRALNAPMVLAASYRRR